MQLLCRSRLLERSARSRALELAHIPHVSCRPKQNTPTSHLLLVLHAIYTHDRSSGGSLLGMHKGGSARLARRAARPTLRQPTELIHRPDKSAESPTLRVLDPIVACGSAAPRAPVPARRALPKVRSGQSHDAALPGTKTGQHHPASLTPARLDAPLNVPCKCQHIVHHLGVAARRSRLSGPSP